MTFRQPYNPDLLGPFDESMRKQEEHIAKNNAIHMDNVELGNETLEAIANLSTKGAGWITDMQEKKRLAAAGNEAGKFLALKYNLGRKPVNPHSLEIISLKKINFYYEMIQKMNINIGLQERKEFLMKPPQI